jgi:hypothetical protein
MATNLTSYKSIQSGIFVRINCEYYKATSSASPSTQVLRFSDLNRTVTVGGESYLGVGNFMAITNSASELKIGNSEINISLSGIPNTSIAEIINSRFKGSEVIVYRGLYNPTTNVLLNVSGNPFKRFHGIITNYALSEEYNNDTRTSSNTITFIASSAVEVLGNTAKGRRTNPKDQRSFYASDASMDRIPALVRSKFNFGAPL